MAAPVFENSYAALPERFFARVAPAGSPSPRLVALNGELASRLGLDLGWLSGPDGLDMLSGNALPEGAASISQAYAGHQFGLLVGQLGDGRAVMIGEVVAPDGARFDLQLKGCGQTPFSRSGDGRAWLGPVLREYLASEFMHAAGVPTTRALAAVTSGERVWRDAPLPGAILTRVASSHVRVGTFEYFALRGDLEALGLLADHVIARHCPRAEGPLGLLAFATEAQARLIAQWMALGFIHGVMNTDNMALSGETIDYGPCAFMDAHHPGTVFSSIDRFGRYAWDEQPQVAMWNLAQLASCLIPLLGEERRALAEATRVIQSFPALYEAEWLRSFGAKLGLASPKDKDRTLIEGLLGLMDEQGADFTRVFHGLSTGAARDEFTDPAAFDAWVREWREAGPDEALMARTNPARIPRNHRIEEAIRAAVASDLGPFHRLDEALRSPFEQRPEWDDLALAPSESERVRQTFCGT